MKKTNVPYIIGQMHSVIDYQKLIQLQAEQTNNIGKNEKGKSYVKTYNNSYAMKNQKKYNARNC